MQKTISDLFQSVVLLLAISVIPTAQAFSFDDLEKVEKVERDERKVREAKAEKARREEEARRQAQLQSEEAARQRANSSSGSGGGGYSSNMGGGKYSVYKDKGEAAAWSWFKREVIVTCEGGRNNGSLPSIYLSKSGRWETTYVGKFDTFQAAATAACS